MGNEMCRVNQYHDEKYQPHVALVIVGSVTMGGISFTVSVVGGPRGMDGGFFNLKFTLYVYLNHNCQTSLEVVLN